MKKILLILCLTLANLANAQIRPFPNRITVVPIIKKKYKNLAFNGRMYEAPGKLRNAVAFMLDPNVASEFDISKFSAKTQASFKEFMAEVAVKKDGFKQRHFRNLLKDLGSELVMGDIDALICLIMMEVAKSSDEDLRDALEEMKDTLSKKEAARKSLIRLSKAKANCLRGNCRVLSLKDYDTLESNVKSQFDSLSEMNELESLRLQMAMDRLSKLMSVLSNLLKKASETASGITQNIK